MSVNITSNGWFGLDGMMNASLGGTIPDASPPNAVIAVHWGDDFTRTGGVCVATLPAVTVAPRFVVEWADSHYCCGDDGTVHLTYEAILSARTNTIDFLYNDMRGMRAQTTGIESPDGTQGVAVCTAGSMCPIATGTRLRFTPIP